MVAVAVAVDSALMVILAALAETEGAALEVQRQAQAGLTELLIQVAVAVEMREAVLILVAQAVLVLLFFAMRVEHNVAQAAQ
jgi:hypothetical protein